MKELNFQEWMAWANATNNLGVANVEPIISKFLEKTEEEKSNSMFIGKTWNGSNWINVSNSFRNMLSFVLLKNPQKYTYLGVLGRSIKELEYHGIDTGLLKEALEKVPEEQWGYFCKRYLPNMKGAISSAQGGGTEKLKWIYQVLFDIVNIIIESKEPAKKFELYFRELFC